jgi:hypothetical protein
VVAEPTLTSRALLPLVSGLRRLGHAPEPLLADVGVNPSALNDPDARFPMTAGIGLLARAFETTGDDCIGLHLAEHADFRSVDVHFYAMSASSTLRDAYARLSRYHALIHEVARVEIAPVARGVAVRHALSGWLPAPRQTAEFVLTAFVRGGRIVTGVEWCPVEVRFAHRMPAAARELERFFGAPVRFAAGENAVVVSDDALSLTCLGADPPLAAFMDRYVDEHIQGVSSGQRMSDRVRGIATLLLHDGEPSASTTASRMNMSVRTLNRALAAEGTTYRAILDQLRHELACRQPDAGGVPRTNPERPCCPVAAPTWRE